MAKSGNTSKWKLWICGAKEEVLEERFCDDAWPALLAKVKALRATKVNGKVCLFVRIFGDPKDADAAYQKRFLVNSRKWPPGFNLVVGRDFV